MTKTWKRSHVDVEQKNGWVYINGQMAQLVFEPYCYGNNPPDLSSDNLYNVITDGYGECGRFVYSIDDIIVKFDDNHYHQTLNEIKIWKMMEEKDRKYFPVVLDWSESPDNCWIAEKKEELVVLRKPYNIKKLNELIVKYNLKDISDYYDMLNWAERKNGSLIIFDWGL